MIKQKVINDIEIRKDWGDLKPKPVLSNHKKIIGEIPYFNLLACAAKGSGKSVAVINIIKKILTNKTILVIFSSTFKEGEDKDAFSDFEESVENDKSKLAGKIEIYESIYHPRNGDILAQKIEEARERVELIKNKKFKNSFPSYVFYFDDLPEDNLRSDSLNLLFKTNRHIMSCNLMVVHRWSSIHPKIRDNIDIILLFSGQSTDNLEQIYKWINLVMTKKEFLNKYNFATRELFSFLYINLKDRQLRKNLNIALDIEDDSKPTKALRKQNNKHDSYTE